MDNLQMVNLPKGFAIKIANPQSRNLPENILSEIEEIWRGEVEKLGHHVFNGRLLSMVELTPNLMVGEFVEYKHYLAQKRRPALEPFLHIKPVGVSGRTHVGDYFLFGKRSQNVLLDKGMFELVPSGGVDPQSQVGDRIAIEKQIEIELYEETGIDPALIERIKPLALMIESDAFIYEVCLDITLKKEALEIPLGHNKEYDELLWIERQEIPKFKQEHLGEIVPASLRILLWPDG